MVKFYMDEHVPRQITTGLKLRQVDALSVQEDGRAGASDSEVVERATKLSRVLFSRDDDMLAIACEYQQSGKAFSGVIYSHQQSSSIGDCVRDLELIARACEPEDLASRVEFLPL